MISDSNEEPRQHYGEGDQKTREGGYRKRGIRSCQKPAIIIVEVTEGKK